MDDFGSEPMNVSLGLPKSSAFTSVHFQPVGSVNFLKNWCADDVKAKQNFIPLFLFSLLSHGFLVAFCALLKNWCTVDDESKTSCHCMPFSNIRPSNGTLHASK